MVPAVARAGRAARALHHRAVRAVRRPSCWRSWSSRSPSRCARRCCVGAGQGARGLAGRRGDALADGEARAAAGRLPRHHGGRDSRLLRAFGETMAVLMVVGNVAEVAALAASIRRTPPRADRQQLRRGDEHPACYDSALMLAALLLMVVVLAFNVLGPFRRPAYQPVACWGRRDRHAGWRSPRRGAHGGRVPPRRRQSGRGGGVCW